MIWMHTASPRGRMCTLLSNIDIYIFFTNITSPPLPGPDCMTWGQRNTWCLGSELEEGRLAGEGGNPTEPVAVREMALGHLPTGQAMEFTCQRAAHSPSRHPSPWQNVRLNLTILEEMRATHLFNSNGLCRTWAQGCWSLGAIELWSPDTSPFCPSTQSHFLHPLSPGPSNRVHIPGPGLYFPSCTSSLSLFLSNHISLYFFLSLSREWCIIRCSTLFLYMGISNFPSTSYSKDYSSPLCIIDSLVEY